MKEEDIMVKEEVTVVTEVDMETEVVTVATEVAIAREVTTLSTGTSNQNKVIDHPTRSDIINKKRPKKSKKVSNNQLLLKKIWELEDSKLSKADKKKRNRSQVLITKAKDQGLLKVQLEAEVATKEEVAEEVIKEEVVTMWQERRVTTSDLFR